MKDTGIIDMIFTMPKRFDIFPGNTLIHAWMRQQIIFQPLQKRASLSWIIFRINFQPLPKLSFGFNNFFLQDEIS